MSEPSKRTIRERLITESAWVTDAYTSLVTYSLVRERVMRYVVLLYLNGNQQKKVGVRVTTLIEGGTWSDDDDQTVRFSHVNVAPADNVQIPKGDYDIENPIMTIEGGRRGPYGKCLTAGHSVNVTTIYWDNDV